ncbi:MAG TPA: pentapeptide repeat-containing protein [Stellaceae bacterium]|nr:pentapeptide repeat-containing protein [Stellaceae bacterium]
MPSADQFEPPQYLSSLTAAINDGGKSVQAGAFAFTVIGLYLIATAFSATDEDLLLDHTTPVAQLGVQLPVTFSFAVAPLVFVLLHFYTLIRYDMLAANLRQFRVDLRAAVPIEADRERCRQLLANVEFVQAVAIPAESTLHSRLYRVAVWVMTAAFPVLALFLVQVSALRYQNEAVTAVQRLLLGADLVGLLWFFHRMSRWRSDEERPGARPSAPYKRAALATLIWGLNIAYLNVPGPDAETVGAGQSLGWRDAAAAPLDFLCGELGLGCRYLDVSHRPLFGRVWDNHALVELRQGKFRSDARAALEGAYLRGRSLRFANLSESDLFGADLRDADLAHADLSHARLQSADLNSADLRLADLQSARLQGAQLYHARLQSANLSYAQLDGADLGRARLQGALLSYAELQGASLRDAQLWGAELVGAQLQGADLRGAELEMAGLAGTQLVGAQLQCSRPVGAQFQGAMVLGGALSAEQLEAVKPFLATKDQCTRLWHVLVNSNTNFSLANLKGADFDTPLERSKRIETGLAVVDAVHAPAAEIEIVLRARLDGRIEDNFALSLAPAFRPSPGHALVDSPAPKALSDVNQHFLTADDIDYWTELAAWLLDRPADRNEPAVSQRLIDIFVTESRRQAKSRPEAPAALVEVACRFLRAARAGTLALDEPGLSGLSRVAEKCQADGAAARGG